MKKSIKNKPTLCFYIKINPLKIKFDKVYSLLLGIKI